jgi:hypothetical protein
MTSSRRLGLAALGVAAIAAAACSKAQDAPPASGGAQPAPNTSGEAQCFNAVADGQPPAQPVFDELGRPGNGETWFAILNHVLRTRARVGAPVTGTAMKTGSQYAVEFQGRQSWVGFDVEAGTALFCSGDVLIAALLRDLYVEASQKPDLLRKLIKDVPASEWDD